MHPEPVQTSRETKRSTEDLCRMLGNFACYFEGSQRGRLLREATERLEELAGLTPPPNRTQASDTFCLTFTGRKWWPLDPRPEDVCIEDIAHQLAMECRFAGGIRFFYSVAQHSVLVSSILPPELALQGLIHDATEAYLLDIPRPIKHSAGFTAYRALEDRTHKVICEALGIDPTQPKEIKAADLAMLEAERLVLQDWTKVERVARERVSPAKVTIVERNPREAEQDFLRRWRELGRV